MRNKSVGILLVAFALSFAVWSAGCGAASNSSAVDPSLSETPVASLKAPGDWGADMLAGGTVGIGMFPAKFTFDISAAPSCANDFVAMNTSLAGVSATAAASRTGTFSGTVTSGTVTIGSVEGDLVLTASTTNNTGLNFQGSASTTTSATNLAAAINRNNYATLGPGHVKVRATSALGVVTVHASIDGTTDLNGAEGNDIDLANTINNGRFAWAGTTMTGGLGKANIVAFNKLYTTQGSAGGLCNQDGPSVYWSYFTGTGTAVTSVVLSGDGDKVAFVENVGTNANLRILKWKAGEGSGAGYPAAPTTTLTTGQNWTSNCPAGNSCILTIAFSGAAATDTRSAPFYDYNNDVIYVGDNNGRVHKFTGVFLGTPTEAGVSWPITVTNGSVLSSAVYDGVSKNIFVGDASGNLKFIKEVGSTTGACGTGSTPCLGSVSVHVGTGTGGAIVDAPIVDGTTGRVIAVNGTETTDRGRILQAKTDLTDTTSFDIGGSSAGSALYGGAFDNTYLNSSIPAIAGHMYVCGKIHTSTDHPALYQLSFAALTGKLSSISTGLDLASGSSEACSPVTEVYNPNGGGTGIARDWIFFSIGDNAINGNPIPAGSCRTSGGGCLLSLDVTTLVWPPTVLTNGRAMPVNVAGSTSGIVVDNVADTATSPQASSIYLTLGTNSAAASPCNTTTGVGCAIKLTQSALQ